MPIMALTYTPLMEAFSCPDFSLPSVDGQTFRRADFASKRGLLVLFICNHCPYVKAIENRLIALAHDIQTLDVATIGICSNDPSEYPEDAPAELAKRWREKNYGFPYLIDESQAIARAFQAVCTPDIFLFDSTMHLYYRGRLDDSWRDSGKVQKQELRAAVGSLVQGFEQPEMQNPSMGCSIKWKA